MQYVIEYELCALFFLILIAIQFFRKRRFPNKQNKLFGLILLCGIADLGLDVISAKTIEHAASVPLWLNIAVNQGYYGLQILFPVFFVAYILILTGRFDLKRRPVILLFLPMLVCEAALLTNPLTRVFFYFDETMRYSRGNWQVCNYFEAMFYLGAAMILLYRYQAKLHKNQRRLILSTIFFVLSAMLIQQLHPAYLITGVSVALALTMMYFTLQNPDNMLDIMSGAFHYSALLLFLQNRLEEKKDFRLIALELCDVRRINSLFGLRAGNEAIGAAGKFLLAGKEKAWVFRMTETRYVVLTDDDDSYQRILKRLKERFERPWQIDGISMMLCPQIRHFSSAYALGAPGNALNLLDMAFSRLPETRDNTSSILEIGGELLRMIHRRLSVETAIRRGLETGEGFELFFQPIYSLEQERFTMAEVLLRFRHPLLGETPPSEFIPIAEQNGLAAKIDEWVIRHACSFAQQHRLQTRLGLDTLEINLSAAGILQHCFPETLLEITDSYGIDPSFIMFEITETAATTAHDLLSGCMAELQRHGFRFALDDFGAGYANITQVVNLPFYAVKLDRSLLVPATGGENTAVVFEDTLRMFKRIGKVTVVEGVNDRGEMERIRNLKADFLQGFACAQPMGSEEFVSFLAGQGTKHIPLAGGEKMRPLCEGKTKT